MLVSASKMSKGRLRTYRSSNFAPSGHHEAPLSGSKSMDLVLRGRGKHEHEHEHDEKADRANEL
jgi:hypothetical protein